MSFVETLSKPIFQRFAWKIVRTFFPVLKIGKNVFISKYEDVLETLKRPDDFTISEINGKNMTELGLTFFLGMDSSEQYKLEFETMAKVVKREDLAIIQTLVKEKIEELILKAQANGKIDVVNEYARLVPTYLIDQYFGITVYDVSKMQHWMRVLFHHLFLNLSNDPNVKAEAVLAAKEVKVYIQKIIAERKAASTNGETVKDNILNRLLALQKENDKITDDVIIRNLSGFIIGTVDTTSKCAVLVMEQLFKLPETLTSAIEAARANNSSTVGKYMLEMLRFNPHNPIVLRYCKKNTILKSKNKSYTISAGSTIYVGLLSAMFDKKAVQHPTEIVLDRPIEYLHFSYGMHACAGKYISMVQISELLAGLLRLNNLKRATTPEDRKIIYSGPFPEKFILTFDK